MGESAESSALEKPPGIGVSGSPKSSRASAAAASGLVPLANVTPKPAIFSWAASIKRGEPPVSCHSLTSRMASANRSRASCGICFTWPQSMRATLAPSCTKMLPGCGSPWIKPAPSIMRPKAVVSCSRIRTPAILDSGEPGLMPRFSITSASLLSGVPSTNSMTSTRREERPCTGSGTFTAGAVGSPEHVCETEAKTFMAAWASARKSSSPLSAVSSSQKTV
mmetsp:Transcript_65914/g.130708  ORF Transcript_65914/g.130708 Transcript_65914/m.130708 type:complete len:222 (-) Transcript_65914:777-1442(-)